MQTSGPGVPTFKKAMNNLNVVYNLSIKMPGVAVVDAHDAHNEDEINSVFARKGLRITAHLAGTSDAANADYNAAFEGRVKDFESCEMAMLGKRTWADLTLVEAIVLSVRTFGWYFNAKFWVTDLLEACGVVP